MDPNDSLRCSEMAAEFAKNTIKLDQTVTQMVLEGLGVRDRHAIDSYRDQLRYSFRMSYYSTTLEDEDNMAKVSLPEHRDYGMTNVIQQHEVEGLEVQLSDGSWFVVPPEPDMYIFVAGEIFNVRPTSFTHSPSCSLCSSAQCCYLFPADGDQWTGKGLPPPREEAEHPCALLRSACHHGHQG
jgi:hypothetical protein